MQQRGALVLLGTVASASLAAAGVSVPRGVGPEFTKFYTEKATFTCIGYPSISIKASQVNDNSCDCPDGSDEPGTAACAHIDPLSPPQPLPGALTGSTNTTAALPGFWCANEGHVSSYVPFMLVNDGVCDYDLCCDGSEEYGHVGGVKCENRCDSIGKEYRKVEEARRKSKERAAKRRRTLAKESRELRRRVEAKISTLAGELKALEAKRQDLQNKYEEVKAQESGKVVKPEGEGGGKLSVLVGLAKSRVQELRDALDKVLDQRDDLKDRVAELEGILRKFREEYNPNFNDEGVKSAVNAWDDYAAKTRSEAKPDVSDADILEVLKEDSETSGINWAEFTDDGGVASDTDVLYSLEAYLPPSLREYIHGKLASVRVWLIQNGILADNPTGGGETRLVTAAREAFEAVGHEVASTETALNEQKADLAKDYGPDDIFRAFKGKCVSLDSGEYEYELCWLDKTAQKSKKSHSHTGLGTFARIDTELADEEERVDGRTLGKGPRMVLRYENGQACWNGPQRRTDVWLACSETEELWKVSESEKCVYRMEVGTPAACEDVQEPGVPTKDEL